MQKYHNKKNGFGIIEVMIALSVLAVVISSFGAVASQSLKIALASEESLVAAGLAQDVLERAVASYEKDPQKGEVPTFDKNVTLNNVTYNREIKIEEVKDDAVLNDTLWRMSVLVQWLDPRTDKDKQYSLTTELSKWQ
ncbi:prepilin-type N-terminal cleavage/methylation domain-containing protein [Patescibacteria group bacterium]|jgi:prepilin-type N-terminal cleavage/methylation domain-containing protein|nr:prepilin-type N-terminal cleavage/methylation domain-containing protein [Patescibacteria group bacterium]